MLKLSAFFAAIMLLSFSIANASPTRLCIARFTNSSVGTITILNAEVGNKQIQIPSGMSKKILYTCGTYPLVRARVDRIHYIFGIKSRLLQSGYNIRLGSKQPRVEILFPDDYVAMKTTASASCGKCTVDGQPGMLFKGLKGQSCIACE